MTEKRYSNDWAKSKSRDLLRNMISDTLLRFRKPNNLSVLCLPGIDAQEVFEVYDKLEIPRQNIVGVEREPHIANELKRKNLGIKVIKSTLEDYIGSQRDVSFDVVSLDYIGPYNEQQVCTIEELTRKQKRNQMVLHTANLVRRDRNSDYLYIMGFGNSWSLNCKSSKEFFNDFPLNENADSLRKFQEIKKTGGDMRNIKHFAVTSITEGILDRSNIYSTERAVRFVFGNSFPDLIAQIIKDYKSICDQELIPAGDLKSLLLQASLPPILTGLIDSYFWKGIGKRLKDAGIESEEVRCILGYIVEQSAKQDKFFIPTRFKGYSYISESGAPMIGDMIYAHYPQRGMPLAWDISSKFGFPKEFKVDPYYIKTELVRDIKRFHREFYAFINYGELEKYGVDRKKRIFLGNASRPVLTKKRAIEEFETGASIDHIQQKYRGWENKPLSQWKAHVSMGTYSSKRLEDIEEVNGYEKITKPEAIELISSGIPINEISQTYPTSFSLGQLRALKAHITMGTYKD